ncbi:aminotransferase [Paenibacillus aestuarii]|uniref:Aminotransferase n=1 Tax=Paenibacillus aestuarii TaxID=516965 RepID=A0ABW0KHH1_9BACL|nr:aminotransferase [Paenibacillus aestuarii]
MNNHRHMIGNGGKVQEVHTRAFTGAPQIGEGFGQFPGLGGSSPFGPPGGNLPVPFEGGGGGLFGGGGGNPGGLFGGGGGGAPAGSGGGGNFLSTLLGGGGGGAGGSSNPLSGLNMKQIAGFVDRMGGIEGILGTMGKVQKFMSSFQQMAPMFKVLFNSFTGKVKNTDDAEVAPRRRKRRKKSSAARKRTGGKGTSAKRNRR